MSAPLSSLSGSVIFRSRVLPALVLSLANMAMAATEESAGIERTGVVRSANQAIPGATVSASQGTQAVVTTTDQNGHYSLKLGQGVWMMEVTMAGFNPARKTVTLPNGDRETDFSLQLKESPMTASRSGSTSASASGQNQNEPEPQLQTDADNPGRQVTNAENAGETNEAFLVSGTLTNGPSANATPGSSVYSPSI